MVRSALPTSTFGASRTSLVWLAVTLASTPPAAWTSAERAKVGVPRAKCTTIRGARAGAAPAAEVETAHNAANVTIAQSGEWIRIDGRIMQALATATAAASVS